MYCKIHFYFFERAGSSETISAARPGQAEADEEPERPGQAEAGGITISTARPGQHTAGGDTKQSAQHAAGDLDR